MLQNAYFALAYVLFGLLKFNLEEVVSKEANSGKKTSIKMMHLLLLGRQIQHYAVSKTK